MNWQALALAVVARRVELGYQSREAFAAAVGLSARVMGDIEKRRRENFDQVTLARLEQALRWPPGRVDAILRGEQQSELSRIVGRLRYDEDRRQLPHWASRILDAYQMLPADEQARVDELGELWAGWIEAVLARVERERGAS
jgi:hypothetical protein